MRRVKIRHWLLTAIALAALLLAYSFVEPYWLQIKEYEIVSDQIPPSFDGARITFLSDFHYGPLFPAERIRAIVEKTNALEPDIVLLGGDYISGGEELLDDVFPILGGLKPALGTFSVLGNHEWPYERRYRGLAEENHITPVDRKPFRVFVGTDSIVIAGSEFYLHRLPDMTALDRCAQPEDFVLYLQHNPDFAEVADDPRIDLMLSGHNHGGQVTLFGFYAPHLATKTGQKYRSGLVDDGDFPVIVSNGIGVYMMPLRFGARPQIVLVHLKRG